MKKIYGGKITLEVFTTVDSCEDAIQERNNAHEDCDFELFGELRTLAEEKGLYVQFVGADLHYVENANEAEVELVNKHKEAAKKRGGLGKKSRFIRIQF